MFQNMGRVLLWLALSVILFLLLHISLYQQTCEPSIFKSTHVTQPALPPPPSTSFRAQLCPYLLTTPQSCKIPSQHIPYNTFASQENKARYESIQAWDGWAYRTSVLASELISAIQFDFNICGSVGEIGVHHGKYFAYLALTSPQNSSEVLFAADLFESQQILNVDHSGSGSKAFFLKNIASVGIDPKSVVIYQGSSLVLSVATLNNLRIPPFRIFSVDGGHTFPICLSDLHFASCVMTGGGVVSVDDAFDTGGWLGVFQALMEYWLLYRGPSEEGEWVLVPFARDSTKMYLTDPQHHSRFVHTIKTRLKGKGLVSTSLSSIVSELENQRSDGLQLKDTLTQLPPPLQQLEIVDFSPVNWD